MVGSLGVENKQYGHLGLTLTPRHFISWVSATGNVYVLTQSQLVDWNGRFESVLPQFFMMS